MFFHKIILRFVRLPLCQTIGCKNQISLFRSGFVFLIFASKYCEVLKISKNDKHSVYTKNFKDFLSFLYKLFFIRKITFSGGLI